MSDQRKKTPEEKRLERNLKEKIVDQSISFAFLAAKKGGRRLLHFLLNTAAAVFAWGVTDFSRDWKVAVISLFLGFI